MTEIFIDVEIRLLPNQIRGPIGYAPPPAKSTSYVLDVWIHYGRQKDSDTELRGH